MYEIHVVMNLVKFRNVPEPGKLLTVYFSKVNEVSVHKAYGS